MSLQVAYDAVLRNPGGALRVALPCLLLCLLAGCPKSGREDDSAARLAAAIVRIDRAWSERGDKGFAPVHTALADAEVAFPDRPELAWRWARYDTGLGLAAETSDEARRHFAEARSAALQCLLDDPTFDARNAELGWDAALEVIATTRLACADWTVFAWLRWMTVMGPRAAELDFARIVPLIDHLRLHGSSDPDRLAWSRGLAQTLADQAAGLSSPRGRALLAQAVDSEPGELARTVDLLLLGEAEISGDAQRYLDQALRTTPDTPEDRRALEQLAELR